MIQFDDHMFQIGLVQAPTSHVIGSTPPEANISPENRPLEEEIPIGNHFWPIFG